MLAKLNQRQLLADVVLFFIIALIIEGVITTIILNGIAQFYSGILHLIVLSLLMIIRYLLQKLHSARTYQQSNSTAQADNVQRWMTTIFEQSPLSLGVVAVDRTITYLNGNAMLDHIQPHQAIGKPVVAVFPDAPHLYDALDRAFKGLTVYIPPTAWRSKAYKSYYYPQHDADGTVQEVLFVTVDSTEQFTIRTELEQRIRAQELAEKALRESAEQLRIMFDESIDIFVVIDNDENVVRINAAVESILGYAPHELVGKRFASLLPASDISISNDMSNSAILYDALPFLCKDGTFCPMELTATTIPWQEEVNILITLRDVSKREEIRRELQQSQEQMQHQQAIMEARLNVIFVVAHQLRTPLATILAATEMLEMYWDKLTIAKRMERLQKVKNHTLQLRQMMTDMLAARDAMSGNLSFAPEMINLEQYCQDVFDSFVTVQDREKYQFELSCAIQTTAALFDSTLLNHILDNLLTNAVKYSPQGGKIQLTVNETDSEFIIAVTDRGIGIPEKARENLFDMFYRADNVKSIQGTGIGLGLAYMSARAHGGTLTYESVVGQGTTFYVRLPVVPAATGVASAS